MTCLIKCIHLSFLSFLYVKKVGENRQTVERQLIGFFVDGLLQDSLKMKLMRDNANSFQAVVNTSVPEHNPMQRLNLRTNQGEPLGSRGAPMEIDLMRHSRRPWQQGSGDRSNNYRTTQHVHVVNQSNRPLNKPGVTCYKCGRRGAIQTWN